MKKTVPALLLFCLLVAVNILAQSNVPATAGEAEPSATTPQAAAPARPETAKDPATDPGERKLSRRERKERIKNLPEKYRQFLKEVEYIMLPSELNTFLLLESDAQRDLYIEQFWLRRDSDPKTAYNEYRVNYAELLVEAKQLFRNLSSDRARIYLVRGRPLERLKIDCERLLQPMEIWQYGDISGIGRDVSIVFYIPRIGVDYQLWQPMGRDVEGMRELLSREGESVGVSDAFFGQNPRFSRVGMECKNGDAVINAIFWVQQNKFEITRMFQPPQIDEEDIGKILRAAVISNPRAPKLEAQLSVAYPGKRGGRTAAEMTVVVLRDHLQVKELNGSRFYNVDLNGEVLKDGKLFENYRYRYDFPAETAPEKLAVVVERFLRPADYQARIKVIDVNSGAEAILEQAISVPYIEDSAETLAREREGGNTVTRLQEEIRAGESTLRIIPLPDDILTGLQHIETMITGTGIKAVEFYLDGKKVMVKRSPPYQLDLDFGDVPQPRKIRAVGLDEAGNFLTGDEITVNMRPEPFRVRIVSPRVAMNLQGKVRVEMDVAVPEGKQLNHVELFLNETRLATLYAHPFIQTIQIPANAGIGYLRAVASLKDENVQPVEDLVFINTPEFLQEVEVHLVELPTTVVSDGKTVQDLPQKAFKVLDEGKPVEVTKFEYVRNLPLSVGLAVDTSGSMRDRMYEAQKAGAKFFQNILKAGDKAFVIAFDEEVQLSQKWSRQLSDLNAALASLRAEEATALYDALVYALYNFQGVRGQKALVVISDGKDTASKFSFEQALEYARRAAVPIYGIGIGIRSTDMEVRYKFSRFSSETGGNTYYINAAIDLNRVYGEIENELRSQYLLGFYPPSGVKPGSKWREVTVLVDGGKAKTIRGYYP
jgi:Ca-activated chloride channel family protein